MSPVVKRKPEKPKIPSKYLLMIYTVICISLIVLTFTTNISESFLRNTIGMAVTPFQKGLSEISDALISKAQRKQTLEELTAENEALKQQIEFLTSENVLLSQDKYELTTLRDLYDLDGQYEEYPKIGARIISWDSSNWNSSFLIDKGSEDGIAVDMNVIAGGGLVGRITNVGQNWSRVLCINDDESNVSACVLHCQSNLIVSGDLQLSKQNLLSFSQLTDNDSVVQTGDKIVTSYISDKYLPGILIGYVSTCEDDSNSLTKSGTISPVCDFSHLSEVLIITELKEEYKD